MKRQPVDQEQIDRGHEEDKISLLGFGAAVVGFIIMLAAVMAAVWAIYTWYAAPAVSMGRENAAPPPAPPPPRLQPSLGHQREDWQDLAHLRRRAYAEFRRRGWVDAESGNVRIPEEIVEQVHQLSLQDMAVTKPEPSGQNSESRGES